MKVLVAEEDSASAIVLRKALETLGHEVTAVANGQDAKRLLDTGAFRLLLSSERMPDWDGLELCRQLRARAADGAAYVYVIILLTGTGTADDRRAGLAAGADDFLVKPLDHGELLSRLEVARRILRLHEDSERRTGQDTGRVSSLPLGRHQRPVGEILIEQGVLTRERLQHALDQQARTGHRLGEILIAYGWATGEELTRARSIQCDMPYVAVADAPLDPQLLALIPPEIARQHQLLPLADRENDTNATNVTNAADTLRVAVADPWNVEGLDLVQRLTRRRVAALLASEDALAAAIERAYRGAARDTSEDGDGKQLLSALELADAELADADFDTEDMDTADMLQQSEQAPIVRLLNTLLNDAVRRRASDVHVEPYRRDFEVRFRIDGALHVVQTLPRAFLAGTVSRIKVLAEMDIAERRVPQDGRITLRVDGQAIDLRVSTLPAQFGERVVIRLLDRGTACLSLSDLHFSAVSDAAFRSLIARPHGMVLVTGPTGSGKTTTLYAALNALRSPRTNIMTCEDPIEYELDRISQSNINPRAGLTFARQLRAILRQDPDVVLVGEIRDMETAEVAFRAALTGHLVLSTLHCNEAAGAVMRLLDMGVAPFLISSALLGVVAQRLVPRLCPQCRHGYVPDADKRALLNALAGGAGGVDRLYAPVGCPACDQIGTRGRVALHEVLTMDDRLQALTLQQADTKTIRQAALDAGMTPLIVDGLEKAGQGLTTLEEVRRKVGAASLPVEEELPHGESVISLPKAA